jgi:protein tyrosine phosphatase (PTP) superfamily phosphohydrolase (DUF442 family)
MVAPADPKGINKAGSPRHPEHVIEAWGYVHGRQERSRLFIGGAMFLAGAMVIVGAFFLYYFTRPNVHQASDAFYRSSELSGPELKRHIKEKGIKTVIRLVGTEDSNREGYEEETAAIAETDAKLIVAALPTSRLPYRSEMSTLFEALDKAERPIFVHCKQGSDRSGLVSAIWLHDYEGRPFDEARKQLSLEYGHVPYGGASAMDDFLDRYAEFAKSHPGTSIKEWTKRHYFEEKPGRELVAWYDGVTYRPVNGG